MILRLFILLFVLPAFACATSAPQRKAIKPADEVGTGNVSAYGKFLKSYPAGIEVEWASFKKKNEHGLYDVLLRIRGDAAERTGIDGMVLRYEAIHGGMGFDLRFKVDGEWHNRLSSRSRWSSWQDIELYLGTEKFELYVDEDESKKVEPFEMLEHFRAHRGNI